jgi:hypothetical protein
MTVRKIIDRFPDFYKTFLPRFFENDSPEETAAKCSDCSMMYTEPGLPESVCFSPDTKCCTYYPNLPNYMVGALLANADATLNSGRAHIRQIIEKGIAVKPHGIMRPAKFQLLHKSSHDFFGRSSSLVCPCFDAVKGMCTLWPFHSAVCNTWFCKHSAGEDGHLFWLSLRNYMLHVEKTLELYTLREAGFDTSEILFQGKDVHALSAREIDEKRPDEKTYKHLWGKWVGREEEFYEETYLTVRQLNRRRFQNLSGIAGGILLGDVIKRRQIIMKPKLPAYLKRNPHLRVEKTGEDEYTLISYSVFDPIRISGRIYRIIDFFNGKTSTNKVCREILNKTKTEPSLDLVLSLYQLRVLMENNTGTISG